jgi:hypothetical protein
MKGQDRVSESLRCQGTFSGEVRNRVEGPATSFCRREVNLRTSQLTSNRQHPVPLLTSTVSSTPLAPRIRRVQCPLVAQLALCSFAPPLALPIRAFSIVVSPTVTSHISLSLHIYVCSCVCAPPTTMPSLCCTVSNGRTETRVRSFETSVESARVESTEASVNREKKGELESAHLTQVPSCGTSLVAHPTADSTHCCITPLLREHTTASVHCCLVHCCFLPLLP